ncbi:hypothetical protein ACQVP2_32500 [Methylobacterium aquaticum]|uniref:hypothetical protein n=1 Tax=Methylobacterium aquaticum TaxID=270351 RepID=UPI003D16D4EE
MTALPIAITITAGGALAFSFNEAGEMYAPEDTASRMAVLDCLARAMAALASQPLEDDPAERPARIAAALGAVGTPAALEALEDLRETAAAHTDAMAAAGQIIEAALPSTH